MQYTFRFIFFNEIVSFMLFSIRYIFAKNCSSKAVCGYQKRDHHSTTYVICFYHHNSYIVSWHLGTDLHDYPLAQTLSPFEHQLIYGWPLNVCIYMFWVLPTTVREDLRKEEYNHARGEVYLFSTDLGLEPFRVRLPERDLLWCLRLEPLRDLDRLLLISQMCEKRNLRNITICWKWYY